MSDRLTGALTFTFYAVGVYFLVQTGILIVDYYFLGFLGLS